MNEDDYVSPRDALSPTPAWWRQAECRGRGLRFTELPHDEAVRRYCRACPVTRECLLDLLERVEVHGLREITDGDTVCGGLTPMEQRVAHRAWRQAKEKC